MRWLTALYEMTRNGIESMELDRLDPRRPFQPAAQLGIVPIHGHGELTAEEVASAGASLAGAPILATIDDMDQARQQLEVFVERSVAERDAYRQVPVPVGRPELVGRPA